MWIKLLELLKKVEVSMENEVEDGKQVRRD